jgi:hypothetical protein
MTSRQSRGSAASATWRDGSHHCEFAETATPHLRFLRIRNVQLLPSEKPCPTPLKVQPKLQHKAEPTPAGIHIIQPIRPVKRSRAQVQDLEVGAGAQACDEP